MTWATRPTSAAPSREEHLRNHMRRASVSARFDLRYVRCILVATGLPVTSTSSLASARFQLGESGGRAVGSPEKLKQRLLKPNSPLCGLLCPRGCTACKGNEPRPPGRAAARRRCADGETMHGSPNRPQPPGAKGRSRHLPASSVRAMSLDCPCFLPTWVFRRASLGATRPCRAFMYTEARKDVVDPPLSMPWVAHFCPLAAVPSA